MDRREILELLRDPELLARYVREGDPGVPPPGTGQWDPPQRPPPPVVDPGPLVPSIAPDALVEVRFEVSGSAWFERRAYVGLSPADQRDRIRQVLFEPPPSDVGYVWWLPRVYSDVTQVWLSNGEAPAPTPVRGPDPLPPTPPPSPRIDRLERTVEALMVTVGDLATQLQTIDRLGSLLRESGEPEEEPKTPPRHVKKAKQPPREFTFEVSEDGTAEPIEEQSTET